MIGHLLFACILSDFLTEMKAGHRSFFLFIFFLICEVISMLQAVLRTNKVARKCLLAKTGVVFSM